MTCCGGAAVVFSHEGAQSLKSSARGIGFCFLDIHRLTAEVSWSIRTMSSMRMEGGYVEGKLSVWEPDLLDQALERLKAPACGNSHW